jgi:hypothetical protein
MQQNFIISLPRSGSTVLTRLLSTRNDVICLPECFFPHLLDHLTPSDWKDRRMVAALLIASCSDGCPLSLDEASECISDNSLATLKNIAIAVAAKEERDPAALRSAVWKSTRLVGSNSSITRLGARFIILHRARLNVYESQFRVPFGTRNENPSRFALFAASYDAAFRRYPSERTMHVDYAGIPSQIEEIYKWIGSESREKVQTVGAVLTTSGERAWHSEIDKPFRNDDNAKLAKLTDSQIRRYRTTAALLRILPFLGTLARNKADQRQAFALKDMAISILVAACNDQ